MSPFHTPLNEPHGMAYYDTVAWPAGTTPETDLCKDCAHARSQTCQTAHNLHARGARDPNFNTTVTVCGAFQNAHSQPPAYNPSSDKDEQEFYKDLDMQFEKMGIGGSLSQNARARLMDFMKKWTPGYDSGHWKQAEVDAAHPPPSRTVTLDDFAKLDKPNVPCEHCEYLQECPDAGMPDKDNRITIGCPKFKQRTNAIKLKVSKAGGLLVESYFVHLYLQEMLPEIMVNYRLTDNQATQDNLAMLLVHMRNAHRCLKVIKKNAVKKPTKEDTDGLHEGDDEAAGRDGQSAEENAGDTEGREA